jgi:hypothetical protein
MVSIEEFAVSAAVALIKRGYMNVFNFSLDAMGLPANN